MRVMPDRGNPGGFAWGFNTNKYLFGFVYRTSEELSGKITESFSDLRDLFEELEHYQELT